MDHITGQQDEELLAEFKDLLYPKYPPGCDENTFLAQFEPLLQYIKRFDLTATDEDTSSTERIILQIIPIINTCLTNCPRRQLITTLLSEIGICKGLLKNLAVGRESVRMSKWQTELGIDNPITKIYAVTDPSLRMATDALYLRHRKIPNLELLLANYGKLLPAKQLFQQTITSQASRVPLDHHHYLAIIAAATFGSKYMFSRSLEAFSSCGGNMLWISQGTSAAPAILQELARFSGLLAYNLSGILLTSPFLSKNGFTNTDREYKLEALVILSYYQCLSSLSLAAGLIPQCDNYEQYLPKTSLEGTSYKSFETLRKCQNLLAEEEQKTAQELGKLFAWQSEEQQLINKIKAAVSLAAKKTASCELLRKIQSAKTIQEEELHQKLQSLRCLEQLKRSFSKFVDFEPLVQAFKVPKIPTQDDIVLASEWQFEMQGLKRLESVMGSKTRGALADLVQAFKVIEDQSKQITHYYQFYNGYIHQFLTYTKLLQKISTAERGYIKLITKSSFLFSKQTFMHMKSELGQKKLNALEFVMETLGCKLQLTVTFITLLLDRDYEETNE